LGERVGPISSPPLWKNDWLEPWPAAKPDWYNDESELGVANLNASYLEVWIFAAFNNLR
jgi:hypothetical protein